MRELVGGGDVCDMNAIQESDSDRGDCWVVLPVAYC